jgi:hypothetical protein
MLVFVAVLFEFGFEPLHDVVRRQYFDAEVMSDDLELSIPVVVNCREESYMK